MTKNKLPKTSMGVKSSNRSTEALRELSTFRKPIHLHLQLRLHAAVWCHSSSCGEQTPAWHAHAASRSGLGLFISSSTMQSKLKSQQAITNDAASEFPFHDGSTYNTAGMFVLAYWCLDSNSFDSMNIRDEIAMESFETCADL